jgi:hypothetical protein
MIPNSAAPRTITSSWPIPAEPWSNLLRPTTVRSSRPGARGVQEDRRSPLINGGCSKRGLRNARNGDRVSRECRRAPAATDPTSRRGLETHKELEEVLREPASDSKLSNATRHRAGGSVEGPWIGPLDQKVRQVHVVSDPANKHEVWPSRSALSAKLSTS